jgi:hypothetical protein
MPAMVTLAVYAVWGDIDGQQTSVVADSVWRPVVVRLRPTKSGNDMFRFQVFLNSTGVNVDVDSAGLRRDVLSVGSLSASAVGWTKIDPVGGTTSMVWQSGSAHSDSGRLRVRGSVVGASVLSDVAEPVVAGEVYEVSVWVRSPSGSSVRVVWCCRRLVGRLSWCRWRSRRMGRGSR